MLEGLFGIIVIVYLIASVVGAVLKRMQQGPIMQEPVFPTRPQLQGQPERPRPIETVSRPSIPSETLQPVLEDRQPVEVIETADEDESIRHKSTGEPGRGLGRGPRAKGSKVLVLSGRGMGLGWRDR